MVKADYPDDAHGDEIDHAFYSENLRDRCCLGNKVGPPYDGGAEAQKNQENVDCTFGKGHNRSCTRTKITNRSARKTAPVIKAS